MTHEPTKRIRRQREQRRLERQRERKVLHAQEAAAVAAYRRSGVAGAVAAIGGGDVSDWPQTEQASGGDFSGVCDNDE